MAQWVSFQTIKDQVSMEQVLEHYGLLDTLTQKKSNLVGSCPIHHGTNSTQFHVSLTKKNYNCFGDCHGGGNMIDFVAAMEGLDKTSAQDLRKAALLMQEWFGLTSSKSQAPPAAKVQQPPATPATAPVTPSPPEPVNPPLKFAFTHLDQEHPYLKERGFTAETIEHFGAGYHAGRGLMHGRVVIPIHNEHGDLVAYAGRWPGEEGWPEGEGKYKLPPNFKKSHVVFNLHRVRELNQTTHHWHTGSTRQRVVSVYSGRHVYASPVD